MYPSADPFADATKGDDLLPAGTEDYIHIRIQQRNGRKTLTTVQGIADDYDKKKLVKAFKKVKALREIKIWLSMYTSELDYGSHPFLTISSWVTVIGFQKGVFILLINTQIFLSGLPS